jgi:hypothetical protein
MNMNVHDQQVDNWEIQKSRRMKCQIKQHYRQTFLDNEVLETSVAL